MSLLQIAFKGYVLLFDLMELHLWLRPEVAVREESMHAPIIDQEVGLESGAGVSGGHRQREERRAAYLGLIKEIFHSSEVRKIGESFMNWVELELGKRLTAHYLSFEFLHAGCLRFLYEG